MPDPRRNSAPDRIDLGGGRALRLREELGRGASSTTRRALLVQPSGLRRAVAVKLFASVSSEDAERTLSLAAATATRAACVRHPNVVAVLDFGAWEAQPYFVTELVEGVNLATLQERYRARSLRLPLDLAVFILCEVAEALSGARGARDCTGAQLGLVHLALGPQKVLLGVRGEVKVSDFGTMLPVAATSSVRSTRALSHRLASLSPEVAEGRPGDSRSDVFSLGVLMRELLVGPRFGPGVTCAVAARLAREGFVQPWSFQPHLPPPLPEVMACALAVDPADRYPNASAMAFELRRIALSLGVGDGRAVLRQTLEREFGDEGSSVTAWRGREVL
jgi:serine/threonine-protein kinase